MNQSEKTKIEVYSLYSIVYLVANNIFTKGQIQNYHITNGLIYYDIIILENKIEKLLKKIKADRLYASKNEYIQYIESLDI